ncbi:recombinase family protein [Labedaea rhizosphaerae]|uniref:Resolvase-like protein n=1 Tax=Labedaea rhizosphaerae TaxID=598644 RepID=A0A4R6S2Z8_LABRH|nr:recombinase family protein [Labedaea rhizosphaerae]TDP94029.1 hypothetical protein EV186_106423 [Labedaea rhizosphaerae]
MTTEKNGVKNIASTPIPSGAQACIQRPKPAPSGSVTPRLVFGYIRMEEPDEIEIAKLRDELARFCLGHGFHLGGVFCDRGVAEDAIARVGFAGALDALRVPESYALLVPGREHLSGLELVERALVRMVNRTGCRVLALPAGADSAVEVG